MSEESCFASSFSSDYWFSGPGYYAPGHAPELQARAWNPFCVFATLTSYSSRGMPFCPQFGLRDQNIMFGLRDQNSMGSTSNSPHLLQVLADSPNTNNELPFDSNYGLSCGTSGVGTYRPVSSSDPNVQKVANVSPYSNLGVSLATLCQADQSSSRETIFTDDLNTLMVLWSEIAFAAKLERGTMPLFNLLTTVASK